MGSSPIGIMALVGNSWAFFLSGGELSLVGSYPRWGVKAEPAEHTLMGCKLQVEMK